MASILTYLRIPAMASSAIVAIASGLLYLKQKCVRAKQWIPKANALLASLSTHVICPWGPGQTKVFHVHQVLGLQTLKTFASRRRMVRR